MQIKNGQGYVLIYLKSTKSTKFFNVCKNTNTKSKLIYSESESEPDFSFAINSVPDFDSASESDSSSAFISLDICIFLLYICINLYLRIIFFIHSHNRINSYASNAGIVHIFFWYFIT